MRWLVLRYPAFVCEAGQSGRQQPQERSDLVGPGQLSRAGVLESGDESRFCLVGRPASRSSSSRPALESHTIVSSSGRHGVRYKHLFYSTFIRARREGTTVVLGIGIAVVVRAVSEGPSWHPFRLQASS